MAKGMNLLRSLLGMLLLAFAVLGKLADASFRFSQKSTRASAFLPSRPAACDRCRSASNCATANSRLRSGPSSSSSSSAKRTNRCIVSFAQPSDNNNTENEDVLGASTGADQTTKQPPEEEEEEEEEQPSNEKEQPPNIVKQNSLDESEPIQDFYQKQEEADRRLMNRLLLPQRMGQLFNTLAIAFIVAGILLNLAGYDFVVRDGRVGIDTVEARQFLDEVNRSSAASRRGGSNGSSNNNP